MGDPVIVVTGATGFTGQHVVRALRAEMPAARLRCLVRPTSDRSSFEGLDVEPIVGDLRDADSLGRALAAADTLVSVASLGQGWNEALFTAVRRSTLTRGVFVSTTAILTSLPVRSRAERQRGEQLVRDSGLAWTLVRPTMIYGTPADRNVARLIRFVFRSPVVPLVARTARQQPVHVEDVAAALVAAVRRPRSIGRTYNIGGREAISFEQLVRTVVAEAGLRRLLIPLPLAAVRAAVAAGAWMRRRPSLRVEQVDRLGEDKSVDYTQAAADLGFAPRCFRDGVRDEIRMIRGGGVSSAG